MNSPLIALVAQASDAPVMKVDTGDTAWMLVSTALVLLMTIPGLALFYGGLVRSKNILSVLMHSLFCAAMVSIAWVVVGYSIAFGPTQGGWCGGLSLWGLEGVLGTNSGLAPTIPHILFVAYQMTFAIITPALISGAFAERMRFPGFVLFMVLWSLLIYAPLAHWVWGGGWIGTRVGALDFAGGTVVHVASGISALVTAIFLGKRLGHGHDPMPPHNLTLTVIGASLLWVGWFGFNAGSALGSGELASVALLNTNTAAAAAALAWMAVEALRGHRPTILGCVSGAVAGLVAITPGAGFVSPMSSIAIGVVGGAVCYCFVTLKPKFGYDDALDVVGVHFVGGTLGALLTGVFATKAINPAVEALTLGLPGGLVEGHPELIFKQLLAVAATIAYCGIGTLVILFLVNRITPLRASREEEILGMDLSQHRERAYNLGGGETFAAMRDAEPKAADAPPNVSRFSVIVDGADAAVLMERWRYLCMDHGSRPSADLVTVYGLVSTVRGNRFQFRNASPEQQEEVRKALESIFRDAGAGVTARIDIVRR
jgi:Amt family ammonium transporter